MDHNTYLKAARSIPIIESRAFLQMLKVSSYPHTDDKRRSDTHKAFYEQAYPNQEQKILRMEDVKKVLK